LLDLTDQKIKKLRQFPENLSVDVAAQGGIQQLGTQGIHQVKHGLDVHSRKAGHLTETLPESSQKKWAIRYRIRYTKWYNTSIFGQFPLILRVVDGS
jgi:hypothetical protein